MKLTHDNGALAFVAHVLLDGVIQRGVQEVDTLNGSIVRGVVGADGHFVFDPVAEDFVLETVSGKVEIEWPPGAPVAALVKEYGPL
jgi:hypothetical protein